MFTTPSNTVHFHNRVLTAAQWDAVPARMESILDGSDEKAKQNLIWRSLLWIAKKDRDIIRTDSHLSMPGRALHSLMNDADLWDRIFVKDENGEGSLILGAMIYHKVEAKGDLSSLTEVEMGILVDLIKVMMKEIVFWAKTSGGILPYDGNPYTMNTPKHLGG